MWILGHIPTTGTTIIGNIGMIGAIITTAGADLQMPGRDQNLLSGLSRLAYLKATS
jgi:hypothetical protein